MTKGYIFFMLGSILLSTGLWILLSGKDRAKPKVYLLTPFICTALGFLCSKMLYYIVQLDFMIADGWLESLLRFDDPAMYSYYGGVLGVILGVMLTARLTSNGTLKLLDSFAPAGLVMAALARFAEGFLDNIGLGDYLEEGSALCFRPVAVALEGYDWTEWYVAVFFLEGLATLIVAVILFFSVKKDRFIRSLFYMCLPQILLETLRSDSISWLFVRVEQLICMIVLLAILFIYGIQSKDTKHRWTPVIICLCCAALFVLVEFMKEGKIQFLEWVSLPACYVLTVLGLIVLALTEIRSYSRWRSADAQ